MNTKLFIGSLSWGTTDAALNQAFSQAGSVVSASVVMDRVTGRSRGFGFVEMASEEDAQKAIDMWNGKDLDGRAINVSIARPREDRPPGGGGFRGGGGNGGGFRGGRGGGGGNRGPRRDFDDRGGRDW